MYAFVPRFCLREYGYSYLENFITKRIFLPTRLYYRYTTMSHFPLLQLLDVIDRLPIRYLRESRTRIAPDAIIAQHFPGTLIPAVIDTSELKEELIGECIYKELWRCSGEYGCTRVATAKATSRSHRCKAQMTVCVYMTGQAEECIACILEDDPAVHGAEFTAPEAAERNDWRSKAIVANAATAGARTIGELLSERFWDAQRVPLPQTAAEKTSLRVRLFQLRKKLAKKSKKEKESGQSESEEKEEADDEEADGDDEDPSEQRMREADSNADKRPRVIKRLLPSLQAAAADDSPAVQRNVSVQKEKSAQLDCAATKK
jgi:hypothetical protein